MEHRPLEHVAGSDAYRRRTRQGALLLLPACVLLSAAAIGFQVPLTGLAALGATFVGGGWLATRWLRQRVARGL